MPSAPPVTDDWLRISCSASWLNAKVTSEHDVDALQPGDRHGEKQRSCRRADGSERDAEPRIDVKRCRRDRRRVDACAEEGKVPEVEQPGEAEAQIPVRGDDRVDERDDEQVTYVGVLE